MLIHKLKWQISTLCIWRTWLEKANFCRVSKNDDRWEIGHKNKNNFLYLLIWDRRLCLNGQMTRDMENREALDQAWGRTKRMDSLNYVMVLVCAYIL